MLCAPCFAFVSWITTTTTTMMMMIQTIYILTVFFFFSSWVFSFDRIFFVWISFNVHESTKRKKKQTEILWIRTRVVLLPMSLSNWLLVSESTAVEPAVLIPFLFPMRETTMQCIWTWRVYDICNETLVCVSRARCLQCSNDYNKIKTTSLFFHVYNFQCYALCCAECMCMRVCEYDRERKTLTLHQLDEEEKKIPSPTKRFTYTCAYTLHTPY